MFQSRTLKPEDAEQVAELHQRAFKNFFLTSLGKSFLSKFYAALIKRKDTICEGYWDSDGHFAGFFAANFDHRGFYKDLCKHNAIPFFISSFWTFVIRPWRLFRLAQSFTSNSLAHGFEQFPYLMSICVDPDLQSKGLGKLMIEDLCTRVKSRGYKGLYLTTDADSNETVNSFYLRAGFRNEKSFLQGKRRMNLFFRAL